MILATFHLEIIMSQEAKKLLAFTFKSDADRHQVDRLSRADNNDTVIVNEDVDEDDDDHHDGKFLQNIKEFKLT